MYCPECGQRIHAGTTLPEHRSLHAVQRAVAELPFDHPVRQPYSEPVHSPWVRRNMRKEQHSHELA